MDSIFVGFDELFMLDLASLFINENMEIFGGLVITGLDEGEHFFYSNPDPDNFAGFSTWGTEDVYHYIFKEGYYSNLRNSPGTVKITGNFQSALGAGLMHGLVFIENPIMNQDEYGVDVEVTNFTNEPPLENEMNGAQFLGYVAYDPDYQDGSEQTIFEINILPDYRNYRLFIDKVYGDQVEFQQYEDNNGGFLSFIPQETFTVLSFRIELVEHTVFFDANGGSCSDPYKTVEEGTMYGNLPTPTRVGYTFDGWFQEPSFINRIFPTTIMSTYEDHTLYAKWIGNKYTVTYNYHGATGGNSSSSLTVTYGNTYGTLPTPTRTNCIFGGWYINENFTTKVISSTVVKTASNHTLYAKWIDNGANDLKYDSTEKYFYFEDGKYPQTYVGTALNSTLNSASLTQTGTLKYFNGTSDIAIPIYTYSGAEYAKLKAGKTMTLTMSGGSFTFTSGQSYWFKVEPIRWRVSAYGVSSTAYPSGWTSYGSSKTNFTVVSDKVLTIGAVTNSRTKEGWSFTSSKLYSNVQANATYGISYHATSGSVSYDKFAPSSGNIKVTSSNVAYTGIRVASEADVKTNFSDMSAKSSDMVKFLLGTSSEYVDYWTRDLVTLDNGKVITKIGEPMSRWLDRVSGVRFAMTMKEGIRVSQS